MIKYALGCDDKHAFESWFPDSASYEKQSRRGLIACPFCGSTRVEKAIMAPSVLGAGREEAPDATPPDHLLDEKRRTLRAKLFELKRHIESHSDDVGNEFPAVARAIHDGQEPERAIRGRASLEEAKSLIEEGIGVLPMPVVADEMN